MFKTTLAGLRAHKLRLIATAMAIVLGVGFVAGTLIFGDTAKAALFDQFARAAKNVDLAVAPASSGDKAEGQPAPKLPLSTVDTVRAIPGVAEVDGRMQEFLPLLDKHGKLVGNSDNPGLALSAGSVAALRPYDVTAGRVPVNSSEAALDTDTVARTKYAVGDTMTVLDTQQNKHTLTLVGVVSFGTSKEYAGQAVVILTQDAMMGLAGATGYSRVVATAAAGTSASELARQAGSALPVADIFTGTQYRDDLANRAINQLDAFLTVLLIFALVACVVSAFVIYNTFNILIAQRIREVALLRCIGASRGQLFGSVLLESAVVGLFGAALGIAGGTGLGFALFSGANALGAPLPSHSLVLTATPVVVALLIGVMVTVTSALIPAWRATRVPPLAALRVMPLFALRGARRRWLLIAFTLLVGSVGTWLTVSGSTVDTNPQKAALLVVAGGMVNFLAVLLLSPLFVGPLTAVIGWLPTRILGVPAKLAVANAKRNPGRTAATTAALMIGVGLMSSGAVALATVQATATSQLALHYPVDYILQPTRTGQSSVGIPPDVGQQLRGRPELASVVEVRLDHAKLDGQNILLGTVDPAGQASLLGGALPLAAGSTDNFRSGSVILFTGAPAAAGKQIGDAVTLSTEAGSATFTIIALATGQSQTGDAIVAWDDFAKLRPSTLDDMVLVRAADGVRPAGSRSAIEAVTDNYPLVSVGSIAEWRSSITSAVDTVIGVIAALLAMAIIIALIGIMNTLSLSVFERTRESAMSRALGLTKGQLRATLFAEALLMGVVGAIVGISFGVLYGWATTRVMFSGFHAIITIPVEQLLLYVGLAAAAAVVAAVLPARKAGRASIVSAMAET